MKKKWTARPYELWDSALVERWLEAEAARGWRITGCNNWWYASFRRTEPAACRVRIRPQEPEAREARRERGELYREFGWEFGATIADGGSDYEVWYCSDPEARELDTDPVAMGWAWEKSLRHEWIVGWLMLTLIPAIWAGLFFVFPGGPLELFLDLSLFGVLVSVVILPLFMVWQGRKLWRIRKARRRVRAGIAPASGGDWRRRKWGWTVLGVLVILPWIFLMINNTGYRADWGTEEMPPGFPLRRGRHRDLAGGLGCRGLPPGGFQGDERYLYKRGPQALPFPPGPLPRREKAPSRERLEVYREMGWTYAATMGKAFHIWRCEGPADLRAYSGYYAEVLEK